MKSVLAISLLVASAALTTAQQETLPKLNYKPVPDFFQIPAGWNLGETSGVAVGPTGNIYVFNRGPHPLLEFDGKGKFLRSICETGVFNFSHAVRIDRENNIWTVDVYGNQIFKINQEGHILMVLGRKGQAGMNQNRFNYPADIAIAPSGDFYVADGYRNSRVVKYDRDGKFLLEWGKKGTGRAGDQSAGHRHRTFPAAAVLARDN